MGRRIIFMSLLLALLAWPAVGSAYLGAEVVLGGSEEFRYALELEPGEKYSVSIAVQSGEPSAQVTLTVQFLGAGGEVVEFISTDRGLGAEGRWTLLGLEFTAPQEPRKAELALTADTPGLYRWDS